MLRHGITHARLSALQAQAENASKYVPTQSIGTRKLSENAIFPKLCVMLKKLSSKY